MRCPRCGSPAGNAAEAAQACVACGFSVDALDACFGSDAVAMDQVTDMANHLRAPEIRSLERWAARFGRRFPPLFVCVYVGAPEGPGSLADFGLWLLNRAQMDGPAGPLGENTRCVLFLVDPAAGQAALQCGYHAERCLPEGTAEQALKKAADAFRRGQYGEGLRAGIAQVERVLRRARR